VEARRREPAPGIFRLVLPLPFPGLDRVNAYLLEGSQGLTLVDCGIYDPNLDDGGYPTLRDAVAATGHRAEEITRLVVTHPHIDHYGMAGRVVELTGPEFWMHSRAGEELDVYRDPESARRRLRAMYSEHGVSDAELDEITSFEDWRAYLSGMIEPTHPLEGGERFDSGDRTWEVVFTPGHSAAHICLWSESHKLLISGDHLLPSVTPHIDFRRGVRDPLGEFLASLEKIEKLEPALVFPGHGRPFEDGGERARAVIRHHDRRLGSILQAIRHTPKTAGEITDDIFGTALLNFQRRLALGEALAHLAYLRRRGEIEREMSDGVYRYRKPGRPS
jgi:glyoxylase-like metal-dependent hydrolase (beta-lactamase superfamily II)